MPLPKGPSVFATSRHKTPLLHIKKEGDTILTHTKLTGKTLKTPKIKQAHYHTMQGHERLTCDSCHTGWAPQCYGCHISFNPDQQQYDHIKAKKTPGRWIEKRWAVIAEQPALGVTGSDKITTFIPGMNLIVDKGDRSPPFSKIYYSSISAHTTQKKGRSCESCHQNDRALGIIERWAKAPQNPAWITPIGWIENNGFQLGKATQTGARSLNSEEIAKIRKVGVCLHCHTQEAAIFKDYQRSLNNLSKSCRVK